MRIAALGSLRAKHCKADISALLVGLDKHKVSVGVIVLVFRLLFDNLCGLLLNLVGCFGVSSVRLLSHL